jgi:hypothetical protein
VIGVGPRRRCACLVPTLVGRLHPGFAAHDLAFSPDGRRVWITSAASFELSAANGYVVTASLLNGRVAVFTAALRMLRVRTVAPETRDVAVVQPLGP